MTEAYLTVQQVAELTQFSADYIYHQISARSLAFYKFGNAVRIRESDVAKWIERKRVPTKQETEAAAVTFINARSNARSRKRANK